MAILRTLPAAVAVAALTVTLVGCGSSDVRDERDQALAERDQTQAELEAEREQTQAAVEAAQAEAQAELEAAQAERDAAQAEAERLAMEQQKAAEDAAAAETARQATIMEAKDALMMAKDALMMVPDDASYEDMLAAEMAVVTAAQGVVDALMENGGSHEEIVAAMKPVTVHQAMADSIQMKIDDAAEADRMMAHRMRVLELDGAKMAAALRGLSGRLTTRNTRGTSAADDVDNDGVITDIADDRAAVWLLHDPQHQRAGLPGGRFATAVAASAAALPTPYANDSSDTTPGNSPQGTITGPAGQASMFDLDDDGIGGVALTAGGLPGATANTNANPRLFSVSVADQKVSVTARNRRAGGPASAAAPGAFMESDRDAPMIAGWTGAVHERSYTTGGRGTLSTGDDVVLTDMVTTYTNQEPTRGRYWNELFFPPGSTPATNTATTGAAPLPVASVQAGGRLVLNDAVQTSAVSDGFPALNRQSITYSLPAGSTVTNIATQPIANFAGTYYGVPGKFTCGDNGTVDTCMASRDARGSLSLASGAGTNNEWRFIPDGDPAMVVVPGTNTDADFMAFGYWVETTTDNSNNGLTAYEVGVYNLASGRTGPILAPSRVTGSTLPGVTGSATYAGPAAGVFARRAYHPEGGGTVETAGRFTADATLMADFDLSDADISGTITNFMHNGEMIDPAWTVTMTEGDIDLSGSTTFVTTATATAAAGDVLSDDFPNIGGTFVSNPANQSPAVGGDGSHWTGMFHGHYQADDPSTPVDERRLQPTGVSGKFVNTFNNGEVLGAFGATRQ